MTTVSKAAIRSARKARTACPIFLLKRTVSPYADFDQLLGVFVTREGAQRARREYLQAIESGKAPDPWAEQAYRKVRLGGDVKIVSDVRSVGVTLDTKRVFVESRFSDGFGQVFRNFFRISGTEIKSPPSMRPVVEVVDLGVLVFPKRRTFARVRKSSRVQAKTA